MGGVGVRTCKSLKRFFVFHLRFLLFPHCKERSVFIKFIQALFNFILRQYGVKDVKVKEVVSLDDETMNSLP